MTHDIDMVFPSVDLSVSLLVLCRSRDVNEARHYEVKAEP